MVVYLGIDQSFSGTGFYCVTVDSDLTQTVEEGLIETPPEWREVDRIHYILENLKFLIGKATFIGIEEPVYGQPKTPMLYALFTAILSLCRKYQKERVFVISNTRVKSVIQETIVKSGGTKVKVTKSVIVKEAKKLLGLSEKTKLNDNIADAFFICRWTIKLSFLFNEKYPLVKQENLLDLGISKLEKSYCLSKQVVKKNKKGNIVKYKGILQRPNEYFYDFSKKYDFIYEF